MSRKKGQNVKTQKKNVKTLFDFPKFLKLSFITLRFIKRNRKVK